MVNSSLIAERRARNSDPNADPPARTHYEQLDANRILVRDKLAVRVAAVTSDSEGWATNQERDIRGIYGAITYRPFKKTSLSVLVERSATRSVNSQGLFLENYSFTNVTTLAGCRAADRIRPAA